MRILLIVTAAALAITVTVPVFAQSWNVSVDANLTLTQNAYSDNWIGGESGALAWTFNSNSLAEKQLHAKVHNKNTLKLFFGQTHNQNQVTKTWARPVKSTDLIDFESVFRFTLGGFAEPFAAGRVETQFLDASDPEKDRFINPITFTESMGMAKVLIKKKKREWIARLGIGVRQHVNRDVLEPSGTSRKTHTSNDGGIVFVTDFKTPLAQERILYTGKLTIFKALFFSKADELKGKPNENYWKSPDLNWENIFTASITKYVMVNFYLQLLYDKEINLKRRLKQTLALGLTYKLI